MSNNKQNFISKAILFDMDGTIVDSQSTVAYHFVNALNEIKKDHPVNVEELKPLLEISFEDLLENFGVSMSPDDFERFLTIYRENYRNDPLRETTIFPGVKEVLTDLRNQGHKLLVATGKCMENAIVILEKLNLADYFDHIQGWQEGLSPKPSADILKRAIQTHNVEHLPAVMVGDTYVDIVAGKEMAMTTVACSYGFGSRKILLDHKPDYLIDDFCELINCLE